MKVLLMMPPMTIGENYANLKTVAANMPSIGIAYIYTAFKEAGCEVAFQDYQCQKATISDIVSYIKKENFDLVGMQAYITNINRCFEIASLIKDKRLRTKIILGGPHATIFRDKVIEHDAVDYVAISEAEHTVKELMECLNKNIEPRSVLGLYYKDKNGKMRRFNKWPIVGTEPAG